MTTAVQTQSITRSRVTKRRPKVRIGLILALLYLVFIVLAALRPQLLVSGDPLAGNPADFNLSPSVEHIAGTDIHGRDIYTRIIYGARYSLSIGLGATLIGIGGGILLGLLAGISGRVIDSIISRAIDVLASFPSILLALVVVGLLGSSTGNLTIALGISAIPTYARVVRAQTMQVIESSYVEQALTFGHSRAAIIVRHVLPNALGVIPSVATIELGHAIMGAAALSFVGLGPQGPVPEWGRMLSESRDYLRVAPWWGVAPGVALTLTVISSTVVGRHLQSAYEKRDR